MCRARCRTLASIRCQLKSPMRPPSRRRTCGLRATPPRSRPGSTSMAHDQAGVWLKLAKANTGVPSMTSDEAVDVGLCYGWISGQRKGLDDVYYLQKYVPRRPRSRWSQVNVRKVEALTAAGRMRPSGIAEVEAAKADGRWDAAYESQKDATVPPDLAAALAANPRGGNGLRRAEQDRAVRRDSRPRDRAHRQDPRGSPRQGHRDSSRQMRQAGLALLVRDDLRRCPVLRVGLGVLLRALLLE